MSGTVKCDVTGEFKDKPADVQEGYKSFKGVVKQDSNGAYYVDLTAGDYVYGGSLPTYSNYVIYRVDVSANTILCAYRSLGNHEVNAGISDYPTLNKKYTYYISRAKIVENEIPSLTTSQGGSQTFTAEIKAGLEKLSPSVTVTMPKPLVRSVTKVTNSKGFKKVTLNWDINDKGSVTGYTIKRYNSKGTKVVKTYNVTHNDYVTNFTNKFQYSIPYAGTHKFSVTAYYKYNGKTYYGKESSKISCKSSPLTAAGGVITKMSGSHAGVTIYKSYGSKGTIIYQYKGGKWKEIKRTTANYFNVKGGNAGSSKYKFKSYLVENKKTYISPKFSRVLKPESNIAAQGSSDRIDSYDSARHMWLYKQLKYSNGKLVLTGKFINSHVYSMNFFKIEVTVKYGNKVIGTKIINSGRIPAKTIKAQSAVTLDNSKTGYDLRAGNFNGKLSIKYKVIDADTI